MGFAGKAGMLRAGLKSLFACFSVAAAALSSPCVSAGAEAPGERNASAVVFVPSLSGRQARPVEEMVAEYARLLRRVGVSHHRILYPSPSARAESDPSWMASALGRGVSLLDLEGEPELYVVVLGHGALVDRVEDGVAFQDRYAWIAGPDRTAGPVHGSDDLLSALKSALPSFSRAWRSVRVRYVIDTCFAGNCLLEFQSAVGRFDFPRFSSFIASRLGRPAASDSGGQALNWGLSVARTLRSRGSSFCSGCDEFETAAKIASAFATEFAFEKNVGLGYAYSRRTDLRSWTQDDVLDVLGAIAEAPAADSGFWESAFLLAERLPPAVVDRDRRMKAAWLEPIRHALAGRSRAALRAFDAVSSRFPPEASVAFSRALARRLRSRPGVDSAEAAQALDLRAFSLAVRIGRRDERLVRACSEHF